MDPLSITIAVCSLVSFTGKTVAALTTARSAFKNSPTEYARLLKELEGFYALTQSVEQLLANNKTQHDSALITVSKSMIGWKVVLAEIQAQIDRSRVQGSDRFARLRDRVGFAASRKTLQDLRAELVSCRGSLAVALQLHSIDLSTVLVSLGDSKRAQPGPHPGPTSEPLPDGLPKASSTNPYCLQGSAPDGNHMSMTGGLDGVTLHPTNTLEATSASSNPQPTSEPHIPASHGPQTPSPCRTREQPPPISQTQEVQTASRSPVTGSDQGGDEADFVMAEPLPNIMGVESYPDFDEDVQEVGGRANLLLNMYFHGLHIS